MVRSNGSQQPPLKITGSRWLFVRAANGGANCFDLSVQFLKGQTPDKDINWAWLFLWRRNIKTFHPVLCSGGEGQSPVLRFQHKTSRKFPSLTLFACDTGKVKIIIKIPAQSIKCQSPFLSQLCLKLNFGSCPWCLLLLSHLHPLEVNCIDTFGKEICVHSFSVSVSSLLSDHQSTKWLFFLYLPSLRFKPEPIQMNDRILCDFI